jgi:hypothetical protein
MLADIENTRNITVACIFYPGGEVEMEAIAIAFCSSVISWALPKVMNWIFS